MCEREVWGRGRVVGLGWLYLYVGFGEVGLYGDFFVCGYVWVVVFLESGF